MRPEGDFPRRKSHYYVECLIKYSFIYSLLLLLRSEMIGRRGRARGPARGRGEPDRGRGRPRRQARGPTEDVQDPAQIP